MINRVTLIGNLGRDPEVKQLQSGVKVAKLSLATNENYRDKSGEWQQNTEWHDVICWRQMADKAENSLSKGAMVYVEGKLTHRTYQDKEGNNRRITEVVANYFRLIDKGGSGEPSEVRPEKKEEPKKATLPSLEAEEDEDLPF